MEITLYSQPTCGQCQMVKRLLDSKKLQYTDCEDMEIMSANNIKHTPTLCVDGKYFKGKEIFDFIRGV